MAEQDGGATQRAIAALAHEDFYWCTRWLFRARKGYAWQRGRHHQTIADALTRVFRGECKRLIINVPPRGSKTEFTVVNWIGWCFGHVPDAEFIHTSYSAGLAVNNSWQVRELVQHEAYRALFPEVRLREDSKAKGEWRTTAGGVMYAAGSGGTITGYGAGKMRPGFGGAIVIDDPIKPDEARSDVIRLGCIDWFQNTLESRKNSDNTPIVLIMQRVHESDLSGWLLNGGNGEEWEHICLPAITDEGESLWEERWPIESLRRMEAAAPYVFAGQYMQRPAPAEGGVFRPGLMPVVDAIPAGLSVRWVRGWDLASTVDGDFTAGAKLGMLSDGRLIIADMVRERMRPEERDAVLLNTTRRDGGNVTQGIPQDPGQAGVSQVRYLTRLLSGYAVRSSPESGDKVLRAEPFASQVNVGNVLMLRAPWNDALVAEMQLFPNGDYDDQVDALSRAFMELGGRTAEWIWPDPPKGVAPGLPAGVEKMVADGRELRGKCGGCAEFEAGRCKARGFVVAAGDVACDMFYPGATAGS